MLANAKNYYRLSKPGIVRMVLITSAFGFLLGNKGITGGYYALKDLLIALLGIGLAAAGSAALNNWVERDLDCLMDRTKNREIPTGKVSANQALAYGLITNLLGVGLLYLLVNPCTAFVVGLTTVLYVLVYTPLKQKTWLNTSIGAVPGALPMSAGWVAATGNFDLGAWILFTILFAWQHPHFYAIAWMYKDDYAKAGHKMLSVVDQKGYRLFVQVILFTFLMLFASLVPTFAEMTGVLYAAGATLLGLYMLYYAVLFVTAHTVKAARKLLFSSLIYLPLLLLVAIVDLTVGL